MSRIDQDLINDEAEAGPRATPSPAADHPGVTDLGLPADRSVSEWLDLWASGDPLDPEATRRLQAVLRFSRPDGSAVFGPIGRSPARLKALESWSLRLRDPSLHAVVSSWMPPRPGPAFPPSPPPMASYAAGGLPLAVLRGDWLPRGDLMAVDHRVGGDETLLELGTRGRNWLGPSWSSASGSARGSRPSPTGWVSGPLVDWFEWTYKAGARVVSRSVTLLKGRSMALIGEQGDGRHESAEMRLELGAGIEAVQIEGSRALLLTSGPGKPTARLLPLGLPAHDRPTDLGSIAVRDGRVVIRQAGGGRRSWVSALICWGRPPSGWRHLTVAERSKACRPDLAVASRVSWGHRLEGLVIYRSLGPPGLRSFLGHQTGGRFLVGGFGASGDVRPILKVGP